MFYDVSYNQNTHKPLTSFECCDFLNVCLKYPFLRLRTSSRPPSPASTRGWEWSFKCQLHKSFEYFLLFSCLLPTFSFSLLSILSLSSPHNPLLNLFLEWGESIQKMNYNWNTNTGNSRLKLHMAEWTWLSMCCILYFSHVLTTLG